MKKQNIFRISLRISAITVCSIFSVYASTSFFVTSPASEKTLQATDSLIKNTYQSPCLVADTETKEIKQNLKNRSLTHQFPEHIHQSIKNAGLTVLIPSDASAYENYPAGTTLFGSKYASLAAKFDKVITQIKQNKEIIKFFRKIHINVLNELYEYLIKIYTTLSLRHVGIIQNGQSIQINVIDYLQDEAAYATNKKTLIINQLVNTIEAQFNSSIQSYISISHLLATTIGKTVIQSDFSIDLTHFILKQNSAIFEKLQQSYLQFLADYIDFFQTYTALLENKNPQTGLTEFVELARNIHAYIFQNGQDQALTKMNPPMFFFDFDTMRSLQIVPQLAQDLRAHSQSISWPAQLVNAATNRLAINNHPIAYFKDKQGNVTTDFTQAAHLYVVTQAGQDLYEQEALIQPDWLNTAQGVIKILRACLGDFSALIGMEILDPCTESLIRHGLNIKNGKSIQLSDSKTCINLINSFTQHDKTAPVTSSNTSSSTALANLPTLPTAPTLPTLPPLETIPSLAGPELDANNQIIPTLGAA